MPLMKITVSYIIKLYVSLFQVCLILQLFIYRWYYWFLWTMAI